MSAPPVRIESKAWTDTRYASLALRLGLPRAEFALVLVATIWRWQTEHYTTERPTYSVPRSVVEGALGSLQGPEALVAADLAELEPDGRLRIKGGLDDTGKSRISWLWDDREQKRQAGKASAARRQAAGDPRAPRGRFGELPPTCDQRATNGRPTATEQSTERPPSSPDSGLRTPDPESLSPAGAREPAVQSPEPPPAEPDRGRDLFASLAEELHDRHADEARKLKAAIKGCENVSIGGGPLMGETRTAILEVVSRWAAEARELAADTREHVTSRMNHLVAVRAATARREKHLRWWTSGRFWRWGGIEIDLGQTVEQVRTIEKPREGARFAHDRRPDPAPAAPNAVETQRQLEAQRAAARKDPVRPEDLQQAKAALGLVDGLAKKLGGQR